jgi:hypothetical protein
MFGIHRTTATLFGRHAARAPASRPRHHRPRRRLAVEALEGRALLSTWTVNSLDDSGDGTLRWAITQANQNNGADIINFSVTGTITLQSALPDLSDTTGLTDIGGPGASSLTVARSSAAGTPDFRIFTVDGGADVQLVGLTITGGSADSGGGIGNAGTLTISYTTVSGNTATGSWSNGGGGIYNSGMLVMADSKISDNLGAFYGDFGGGIYNAGTVILTNCTISGNTAWNSGGGISNMSTLSITDSTISGNSVTGLGGGIDNSGGTMTVTNSTIAGNSALVGGGIDNDNGSTMTVTNSAIAYNYASSSVNDSEGDYSGGGVFNWGTMALTNSTIAYNSSNASGATGSGIANHNIWVGITINNTIVALNNISGTTADDIAGPVSQSSAYNLIGTGGSGGLIDGINGNKVGVADPGLGTLAENGGPTQTIVLLSGSPAIDAGSNGLIPSGVQYDQRGPGFQRIVNATGKATATVDIGAFEWQPYVSSSVVGWGKQTAPLRLAADGLHLLPEGRKTDLPWLNINKLTITLSTAETLTTSDVIVSSTSKTNYGPVTLSGSGTNYTITLAKPISQVDRVTFKINLGGIVTSTFELDVVPGDVNDDGVVSASDVVLIRNAILKTGDPLMIGWCDLDGNGAVDMTDFSLARKRLGTHLH